MPQIHNIRVNNSSYRVEVANTPHLTSLGLSFRTHLPSNGGMLFVFPDEVNRIFHMRNMKIPLDIIFIGADKRVKWIIENAQPDNERLVSLRPSKYVLEVNAGDVKKNSISMHSKLDTLNNPLIKSSDTLEGWIQKQDGGGDGGGFSGTAHTSEGTNTFTRTFGPSKDNKKPWAGKKKKNWAKILTSAPDEEHITVAMLNEWLEKQERDIPSEMRRRGLEPKTGDWEHPYRWVRSIDSSTLSPPEKIQSIIESAPDLKHVLDSLSEVGQPYLVGGCVRDILIGKDCKDFDIEMYGVPQDELGELIQSRFGGSSEQVGKQFGVFKVGDFDISLPRTETQTGEKHTDFDVVPDHTLDPMTAARRRDFTINAMMYDVKEGTILDFFGGEEDLSNGLIKHIDDETFVEDPLRVYRAAQFAARFGFNIDPSTQELASQMDLSKLPIERVNEEFTKMLLKSDTPSIGLDALSEMGVLSRYFPEIAILDETPQRDDYHAEGDVFIHTKMVLDRATDVIKRFPSDKEKITIMLASLCHDLGKPSTTEYHSDGSVSQHGHEAAGIDPTRSFLSKLTREVDLINDVEFLVENHLLPPNYFRSKTSDATFRKLINRYGMRRLKLLSAVSEADILGRLNRAEDGGIEEPDNDATEWFNLRLDEVAEKSNLTLEGTIKPLITGHELKDMGFTEGRELGDILRDIKSHQETGQIADSSEATEYVRNKYMSKGLGDLVDWLFKAVSSESIAEAKRKGLVPQSGDWIRPKRWVRPEDADVVVEEPDAPRVYSYDEVKKFVEDKVSINFDFNEKQKQHGTWAGSEEYKLAYDQIEDIIEVVVGSFDGGEEGPTPKHVYEGFGEPKRDRLHRPVGGREGKRNIPKWQLDRFIGNFQLEWDESPGDSDMKTRTGGEFSGVAAHCDVDSNIVLWRTKNHVTYGQQYPATRHQHLAEIVVHELGHAIVSDMRDDVPSWVTAHLRNAYSNAVESGKGFVSKYSTVDSNEFFAESFKTYISKTDLLERTNPEIFELLEILNQADSLDSLHRPFTEEEFDKYDLKNMFSLASKEFKLAFERFEYHLGRDSRNTGEEDIEKRRKQVVINLSNNVRNSIGMGLTKEDLMGHLQSRIESQEQVNQSMKGMQERIDTLPESMREVVESWEFKTYDEFYPNVRPVYEEIIDSVISTYYPDYGNVEPWISMYGRKDVDIKKQSSHTFKPMERKDLSKIDDPIEIGNPVDEESIREASEFIREQKEKQLSDDESLEKAVSTESIASAKRRGLIPQSGDWMRPRRWVRPEDADVVDEDEASLATQNVYTAADIEKKLEPTIEVKGFPGIGRGRPKTGMSQHEKDRATETLSKGKSVLFKALDGLGKPNPFENGERTLPKWQIDKLNEIDFNWDVVDSEAADGYTGEVFGSVHVGTKKMSLNGLTDRFPKYTSATNWVRNPETLEMEDIPFDWSYLAKEDEDAFMNTIIHELAHCVATEVTDDIPYWFWSQVEGHYRDALDTHQGIKADLASHEGVDEKFPSDYSRRNVSEFFAECFKTYMTNTELLRDINPEMFELMEILNSTSPDKMEVRPLNEEEIKGDLNLRERPVYVGQGFQKYVRSEILAGAMQKIVKDLEDELAEWKEKHGTYASAKNSSTTMYYLNEIRKEKKELEEWKVVTLTNRRIVIGNIKKAIASGFTKEDIQQGLEQSKRQKSYLEPAPDHFEDFNLWIDEEIKKYPTYGKDYPWTSISPSIVSEFVKIDKQDSDLTEEDYETYVEIYETPTVIRDGEEVSDSITKESVREVGKNIEKATDSKLHRKTEFVIEDTGYEPLAGTWKKVLVGGEPRWINEMGEYKDFSDFKGLDIKKQDILPESRQKFFSSQPNTKELAEGITHLDKSTHCSQCDDDCACVTDLDCECPHDCICPDIVALGQDNDNLVSSMVIQKAVTAESVSDARRKGLIPQSGDWMKPRRWIRPVSDVPEKTDEPVTEKSVPPNRQNVDLHNELVSFAEEQGLNYSIESDYVSVDISRAKNIADAYESMEHAPNDPEVKASYNAMANETKSQWDYLESIGYVMEPWSGDGQPYKDSKEMVNDIIDNKHIYFFTTEGGFGSSDDIEEDHPLLQDSGVEVNDTPLVYNDLFRAVHDVIGHSRGNQFGARGEENAWTEHRQLYSPLARKAMTTETRGQNSWVNFGPHLRNDSGNMLKPGDENYISPRDRQFADQKAGLLPEEFLQKMLLKLLKKQVSIFHCAQCSSGCDCVLENHTCECYHDCTCPDNSLSNGSVDIIIDVDSLSSFLNLQKAVVSTPMSGEGKFNAKGVETGDSVWITVNDPESPLRGRHILITKRPDGLFALTGGGGQSEDVEARKHIILTGTPKESKRDKELKQTIEEAEEVNSEVIAEKRGLEQEARDRLKSAADSMTEALGIKKTDTKALLDKKDEVQLHVESVLGEDSSVEAKRITDTIMRQATQANRKISTGVQRERQAILIKVGRKLREVQEAGGEKEVDTSIIPDTIIPQGTTIEEVVESDAINVDVLDEINEALPKFEPVSIPLPDIAEIAEMTPSKQESAIATHFDKEVEKFFGGKDDELDGVAEEDKVPEKPEEETVTVDLGTAVSEPLKLTSQEQLEEAIEKTRAYFETRKEVQLQSEKIKKVPLNVVTPSTLSDLRDSISAIDVNIDDDELEKLTKDNFDSWTRNNQALAFYDAVGEFWNDDISLTEEISGAGSKIQSTMKFHMDSGAATALAVLAKEHLGLKIDTRILMEKGNIELAASSVAWAIRDKYKADSAKLDETIDSIRTANASNLEETERKSLIRHSTLSKQMEEIQKQKESGELLDKVKVSELERNNLIEQRINLGVSLGSMQASATLFDQLVKVRTAKDNVLTLNAGEHRRDAETVASNLRLKEGSYDIQPTEEGTWNVILSSDGLDKHISQEKDLQAKHDKYDKIKTDDTGLSEDDDGNVIVEDFDVPFWNDRFVPEGEEDTSKTIDYKWRAEQRNDINWLLATTEKSADNPTGEGGGLITRTVGAGKTNTALGFFAHKMQENSDYKSIVAVPKGRAQQWFDEANRFMTLPEGMNIQLIPEGASKSDVDDILLSSAKGTLFITGHRELSRSHEMLGKIQTNAELGEKIGKFGGICIDEPQELQARGQSGNMGALGRCLMKLPIDHRVGLTATPARRSPLEVYDLIKWSSGATDIGAKTTFQHTFGGFGSGTNAQDTAIRKVFYETIAPYISGDRITQPTFKVNSDTIDITRTDSQIARQKEIESTRDKTISEHQKTLMDEARENPNHRLRRGANWETTLPRRAKAEARKEVEKQHQENMDGGDWQNNGRLVALREQLEGASDKKHVVYIDSGTQRNALTEMLKDMGYNQNQIKSIASTTYSSGLSGMEMSDRVKKFRKGDIPFILIDSKSSSGYNLQNGDQLHVIGTPPEAANYVQAQGRIARMPRKGDVDIKTYRYGDSPTEQSHWNDLDAQIKLLRATAPGLFRGQYEEEL